MLKYFVSCILCYTINLKKEKRKMAKTHLQRALCLVLVLVMLFATLCACVNDPETPDDSQKQNDDTQASSTPNDSSSDKGNETESETKEDDDLPELNFNNETFTFLAWEDVELPEFGIDEKTYDSSDITERALYERIKTVEARLGVKIEFVYKEGDSGKVNSFTSAVGAAVSGGHEYDAIASYSRTTAVCAANGYLYDLKSADCKYLNFDKPWWPSSLIDEATVKGKLYFASGDISPNALYMMYLCYVNNTVLKTYHSDMPHPQTLVESGNWTYEKFFEYCQGVYFDHDGDGQKTTSKTGGNDTFAYMTRDIHLDPWFWGTGVKIVEKDSNGNLQISSDLGSEKVINTLKSLTNLIYNTDYAVLAAVGVHQTAFSEDHLLFCVERAKAAVTTFSGVKNLDYSVLPAPTYDENTPYVTLISNPVTLYGLPVYAKVDGTVEMGSAVLEALASESYRSLTPAIFEVVFKLRYSKDETSAQMFDKIKENISFDFGRIYSVELGKQHPFRNAILNNAASAYSKNVKESKGVMETKLAELQTKLEKAGE